MTIMDGEGEKHDDSKKLADFLVFREDQKRFWTAYDRQNAEHQQQRRDTELRGRLDADVTNSRDSVSEQNSQTEQDQAGASRDTSQ